MSAEYMAGGNGVVLCERHPTFETATRNTLDISPSPCSKKTHLP